MNLGLYRPESLSPLSIEPHRKYYMRKKLVILKEILNSFVQVNKSLTSTDLDKNITNSIVFHALSVCFIQYLWWVFILKTAFVLFTFPNVIIITRTQIHIRYILGQEH